MPITPISGRPISSQERLACGIADSDFDSVIGRSRSETDGVYRIPGVRRVHDQIVENIREMLLPLQVRDSIASPDGNPRASGYEQRLEALVTERLPWRRIGSPVPPLTGSPRRNGRNGDSLHLLIMDLHKELNRLQRQIATESHRRSLRLRHPRRRTAR